MHVHFIAAFALILTGSLVAFGINPINSIICLISTFVITAILLFLFRIDFLSLIFIIVYVGAIAVLFLFVVMMIAIKIPNTNFFNLNNLIKILKKVSVFITIFILLITFLTRIFSNEIYYFKTLPFQINNLLDTLYGIDVLGQGLYNYFGFCFLIAGLILLVALIGSILLTHNFSSKKVTENSEVQLTKNNSGFSSFSSADPVSMIGYGIFLTIFSLIVIDFSHGLIIGVQNHESREAAIEKATNESFISGPEQVANFVDMGRHSAGYTTPEGVAAAVDTLACTGYRCTGDLVLGVYTQVVEFVTLTGLVLIHTGYTVPCMWQFIEICTVG